MLSKVANRIYWLSRYMERAENSARLVNVYTNLLLDMPKNPKLGWHTLMTISGAHTDFNERYGDLSEGNIIFYMLADRENAASLASSLSYARENARTTRDILPSEVWNVVNEAYLESKNKEHSINSRSERFKYLNNIIQCGQRFEGILSSGMSRNDTYRFFILGRMIERADMITRVLDVGSLMLSAEIDNITAYNGIIWMNLLRSIAAYQMYRQAVKRRVSGEDVIRFLTLNKDFPRTIWYCAETISKFSEALPNHESVDKAAQDLKLFINNLNLAEMDEGKIHVCMDDIQKRLMKIGGEIDSTWFNTKL